MNFITELRRAVSALRAEQSALLSEVDSICADAEQRADSTLTAAEQARHREILSRASAIKTDIASKEERIGELEALSTERNAAPQWRASNFTSPRNDAATWQGDASRMSDQQALDTARRALEATQARNSAVPAAGLERVSEVLSQGVGSEPVRMARWAIVASNPDYEGAFAKMLRDPERGHLEWTAAEHAAYRAVQDLSRAMNIGATTNGGFMVPFTLDPTIMLTNDGSNNPLRRLATVKLTTTNTWNGITSAGATAEWKSEGTQVADGSPVIAQPSIPVFTGDSFVPYSFEYGMDVRDALNELAGVLIDSAENLMATAYTTGNGTTAPQGIVTGLAGTSSEINTTGSEALDDSDPFVLQNALPARFSANATWQSHISTANTYRQMETTNGALQFPELRQSPPSLLGKPWYENSNMDGSINAAATANNYALIYGDVAKGYFIVDRIGTTLELIPNLFGADQRPTGQRGALLWFRTGGEVVVPQALRLLDIPTAA